MNADEIDYRLIGDDLQGVIVTLDPGEAVVAEAGAMMYMQDGIAMATTLDASGRQAGQAVDEARGGRKARALRRLVFRDLFRERGHRASRRRVRLAVSGKDPGRSISRRGAERSSRRRTRSFAAREASR